MYNDMLVEIALCVAIGVMAAGAAVILTKIMAEIYSGPSICEPSGTI
jgi:hypothetical protein